MHRCAVMMSIFIRIQIVIIIVFVDVIIIMIVHDIIHNIKMIDKWRVHIIYYHGDRVMRIDQVIIIDVVIIVHIQYRSDR